jgi:hypothetical protein
MTPTDEDPDDRVPGDEAHPLRELGRDALGRAVRGIGTRRIVIVRMSAAR